MKRGRRDKATCKKTEREIKREQPELRRALPSQESRDELAMKRDTKIP